MPSPHSRPLAFIIGAGPGIGLAVARRFAREGFDLALVARTPEELIELECALRVDGAALLRGWSADLQYESALESLLRQLDQEDLRPAVLVYNASAGSDAPPSQTTLEDLDASLQVNVRAPLACIQALLPAMRKAGRGTILLTGGGLALEPKAAQAALSLGKSATRALALCLAQELAPEGLHVATVTVAGWVRPATAFSPEIVAEAFWELHGEAKEGWRTEVVLRP